MKDLEESKQCDVFDSGWPDLLIQKNGRAIAAEVKSPGDVLRGNQYSVHRVLREAGIAVVILHVDYAGKVLSVEGPENDVSVWENLCGDSVAITENKEVKRNMRVLAHPLQGVSK